MGWARQTCVLLVASLALLVSDYEERKRGHDLRDSSAKAATRSEYLHGQMTARSMWDQVDGEGFPHFNHERRAQEASVGTLAYPLILALYGVGFFTTSYMRFARDEI